MARNNHTMRSLGITPSVSLFRKSYARKKVAKTKSRTHEAEPDNDNEDISDKVHMINSLLTLNNEINLDLFLHLIMFSICTNLFLYYHEAMQASEEIPPHNRMTSTILQSGGNISKRVVAAAQKDQPSRMTRQRTENL